MQDAGNETDGSGVRTGLTAVVINDKSGTVRSIGAETVKSIVESSLSGWDEKWDLTLGDGPAVGAALEKIVASRAYSRVLVGGGDGTINGAAAALVGTDIALGILPLGTMNLMAKALGMDLTLEGALAQLRTASAREIDVARVDGRVFLHHVSFGIQPRMVRIRERLGYSSRITKILSGLRALVSVLFKPQSLRLKLKIDGRDLELKVPALVVSNNIYEDSMWLKQARLDEGLLGIYALKPVARFEFVKLALDLLRGRWRDNLNIHEEHGKAVTVEKRPRSGPFRSRNKSKGIIATIDGELTLLNLPVPIEIDPRALQVLVPEQTAELQ